MNNEQDKLSYISATTKAVNITFIKTICHIAMHMHAYSQLFIIGLLASTFDQPSDELLHHCNWFKAQCSASS